MTEKLPEKIKKSDWKKIVIVGVLPWAVIGGLVLLFLVF